MIKKTALLLLSGLFFVCQSALSQSSGSSCSTNILSTKVTSSGSQYIYTVTFINTGSTTTSSKLYSNRYSSTVKSVAPGQTTTISVPFTGCTSITLENTQTITNGNSTSTSKCSVSVCLSICSNKPTPIPTVTPTPKPDCAGVPGGSAKLDSCGVCNGDGTSCVGCDSVNIQGNQLALDVNINSLRDYVLKINKQLQAGAKNAKLKKSELKAENKHIASSNVQAQQIYSNTWQTIYTGIPSVILSCPSSLCVSISNASFKSSVENGSASLYDQAKKSYNRLLKIQKKAKRNRAPNLRKVNSAVSKAKKILTDSAALHSFSLQELSRVPASHSAC